MEGGAGAYTSRMPEDVFRDFRARRAGMIKALTTDVEKFYELCDPEKENLCLYGLPDETWEVNLPAEEVPPELPEPALGINFARDGMEEKDWLALVAVHSDAWLLAVAFYFAARFGFDKEARRRLFNMINNLPTIYEVVTGTAKKQSKEKTPNSSSKSNKSNSKALVLALALYIVAFPSSLNRQSPLQNRRECHPRRRKRAERRTASRRTRRSMAPHCVGRAAATMRTMSSGYAVTSASGGSMAGASESHQLGQST